MSEKPLVYISGPISQGDVVVNTHAAMKLWHEMWKGGLVTPICPHWSMIQHLLDPLTHKEWLDYDKVIIARCDALLRMPGESEGADEEVECAISLGLPVFLYPAKLYGWARKWKKGDDHL